MQPHQFDELFSFKKNLWFLSHASLKLTTKNASFPLKKLTLKVSTNFSRSSWKMSGRPSIKLMPEFFECCNKMIKKKIWSFYYRCKRGQEWSVLTPPDQKPLWWRWFSRQCPHNGRPTICTNKTKLVEKLQCRGRHIVILT